MGQTIYWVPLEEARGSLSCSAPSAFRELLERVFYEFPVRLNDTSLVKLSTLRDAFPCHAEELTELIDAIAKHGLIEVSAE